MSDGSSPCLYCTRVPDPDACGNKHCTVWAQWFQKSWDRLREYPRSAMDRAKLVPMGVPLGGRFYAHPHRVREYLAKCPCQGCFAKDLCHGPCKVLTNWKKEGGTL